MKNIIDKFSLAGGIISIIGALAFLLSGYGYQWGWWGLGFAFSTMLYWGGIAAFAGFLITIFGLIFGDKTPVKLNKFIAVAGLCLSAATLVTISYWAEEAGKYPGIHDITTDTENPPTFVAIVPLRKDAPNKTEYGGNDIAKIQKEHYPDIETLYLDVDYSEAYEIALNAAKSTSWELVASDKNQGRIEATHKLAWYGFKDDVVIRVDTADTLGRSKIDVRSVSRVGRGDIGVNAHRIRDYLELVRNNLVK